MKKEDEELKASLNPAAFTDFGWVAFGYISAKMYALSGFGDGSGAMSDMKSVFSMNEGRMHAFHVGWSLYMKEIGRWKEYR